MVWAVVNTARLLVETSFIVVLGSCVSGPHEAATDLDSSYLVRRSRV
jgi:hypothetical protein